MSAPTSASRDRAQAKRVSSSSPFGRGRFLPGIVLARRYRIFGLLGTGGMGEVYRADDLKLGQTVALKFLPRGLEKDEERLERLLAEVRIARQISHPNVCRVYDIAEVEHHHFISMEYVDGEDLASLLKRIGRLPKDKAVQIAWQLCAGLAAAHEQGVLHRDLKPANVMIDGRGRARITDFGLAGLVEEMAEGPRVGTPAYMAPEQLAGRPASVKTDLYALGLVLYELFTGRPAFRAASPGELARLQPESSPSQPSALVEGFDPAVERAILRCLEKQPHDRPASAMAVAKTLPGRDPLAAAIAAGETPSPELIAEAGETGGLHPVVGAALFAGILLGIVLLAVLARRVSMIHQIPLDKPPEALAVEAREIRRATGQDAAPLDTAYGFTWDDEHFDHVERNESSSLKWRELPSARPAPLSFWYRQSPRYLVPWQRSIGAPTWNDPPPDVSGMASVRLDPEGHLTELLAVPPQLDASENPVAEPGWAELFEKAGLDLAKFRPAHPAWNPLVDCDSRSAWEGAYAARPDVPIRVETGAYRGRPVYFKVVAPWNKPLRMEELQPTTGEKAGNVIFFSLYALILVGGVLLARRNLRLGRGDRRGAFRLVVFLFVVLTAGNALQIHHVPEWSEVGLIFEALAWSFLFLGIVWVLYIALEPYVRRLWPEVLVSWSRLLAGRWRDPSIGRDILIGGCVSVVTEPLWYLPQLIAEWLDLEPFAPVRGSLAVPEGARQVAGLFLGTGLFGSLLFGVGLLFLMLLMRVILRRQWAAILALMVLGATSGALASSSVIAGVVAGALAWAILLFVLIRFGLLAVMAGSLVPTAVWIYPLDFSAWYAGGSVAVLLASLAFYAYGLYTSVAGRPLMRRGFLPE
jgi:serine/threonine-protein kinase